MIPYPCRLPAASAVRIRKVASCIVRLAISAIYTDELALHGDSVQGRCRTAPRCLQYAEPGGAPPSPATPPWVAPSRRHSFSGPVHNRRGSRVWLSGCFGGGCAESRSLREQADELCGHVLWGGVGVAELGQSVAVGDRIADAVVGDDRQGACGCRSCGGRYGAD